VLKILNSIFPKAGGCFSVPDAFVDGDERFFVFVVEDRAGFSTSNLFSRCMADRRLESVSGTAKEY